MPRRIIEVSGERWEVQASGRITQYVKDELGLVFSRGTGAERERRVIRFSPLGGKNPELALSQLSEVQLRDLFAHSQPAWTSPETGYRP
jgi:hypothetical protein